MHNLGAKVERIINKYIVFLEAKRMAEWFDYPFRKILAEAASAAPTPGGGSVAAMAGVLGASMAAMVGNLTLGKQQYAAVAPEVKEITGQAYFVMARLEKLMEADMAAFNKLMSAYRMPKGNEAEKSKREEALQKALQGATSVPLEIAAALLEMLKLIERLAGIGNKMAISDAGVAAYVCEGALQAVLLNVDINLNQVTDATFAGQALQERESIAGQAQVLKEKAVAQVSARIKE